MTRGGPRPGAGRPPTRGESATEVIQIRVTPAEKAALTDAATRARQTLSSYTRQRLGLQE